MTSTTEIIRELIRAGLSQSDIARTTGIPQPRLSRWVSHGAPISADDALRLVELHRKHVVALAADQVPAGERPDAA